MKLSKIQLIITLFIIVCSFISYGYAQSLMDISKLCNSNYIKKKIKDGLQVNKKDKNGNNLLSLALQNGCFLTISDLIKAKADITAKNNHGITPLMYAAKLGGPRLILIMSYKQQNFNIRDNFGKTALFYGINTCTKESIDNVYHLLNGGADVKIADNNGTSPLMYACKKCKSPRLIKTLLLFGADIQRKNKNNESPLSLIQSTKNKKILILLQKMNEAESTASPLLVYQEPNLKQKSIASIPFRKKVTILSRKGPMGKVYGFDHYRWIKIRYNETVGWVWNKYINILYPNEILDLKRFSFSTKYLSVWENPCLSLKKTGILEPGEIISIRKNISCKQSNKALKKIFIQSKNGIQGWVNSRYVKKGYVVSLDGTGHFKIIQDAIDYSKSGDTIFIKDGDYFGRLIISDSNNLTIVGDKNTWIKLNGHWDTIMTVFTAKNLTLKNLKMVHVNRKNAQYDSYCPPLSHVISLYNSKGVLITNNVLKGSGSWGVNAEGSSGIHVIKNKIMNCTSGGIYFRNCANSIIAKNIIAENLDSIRILQNNKIEIFNNTITKNNFFFPKEKRIYYPNFHFSISFSKNIDVYNNIIVFNKGRIKNLYPQGKIHFSHNLKSDPHFKNAPKSNYQLKSSSPAIRAGRFGKTIGAFNVE